MNRGSTKLSTIAIAIGIVSGSVLVAVPFLTFHPNPGALNPGPGQPSVTAFRQVQDRVNGTSGGPWGLVSMEGVVSTSPSAPFLWGQDRCQALPGPTLWNLSGIQSLSTSLWGGRALFWQMVFINQTGGLILASNADGTITLDGPLAASTPCVSLLESAPGGLYGSFPPSYWSPNGVFNVGLMETLDRLNSSAWAPTASDHLGNASFSAWNGRGVGYYTLGFTWLNLVDWTAHGWLAWYQACGIPGRSGPQPYSETGWGLNSSPTVYYGSSGGELSCPVSTNSNFLVTFNRTGTGSNASGNVTAERLTIGVGYPGSYVYYDTANSLVSWMSSVSLTNSSGNRVPPIAEACVANATTLADCASPRNSWYAVLLSPNGWVLDTYPSATGGDQWNVPNVFLTNNDTLVLEAATSLTGIGDRLSLSPTYTFPQIAGSVNL